MKIDLSGKVAIVTGAGRGLGRAHALLLAQRGAKVVVNDLGTGSDGAGSSGAAADQVASEIRAIGGEALVDGSSVTDFAAVEAMVSSTVEKWGRVDILVNNAGFLRRSEEHTYELQSLMRISYDVFGLKKKQKTRL